MTGRQPAKDKNRVGVHVRAQDCGESAPGVLTQISVLYAHKKHTGLPLGRWQRFYGIAEDTEVRLTQDPGQG